MQRRQRTGFNVQSVDRPGRPQLQLPSAPSRPTASRDAVTSAVPVSSLSSLSLFLCLCVLSTCTRIFASFDSRRNVAQFWPAPQRRRSRPSHFQQLAQPGGAAPQQQPPAAQRHQTISAVASFRCMCTLFSCVRCGRRRRCAGPSVAVPLPHSLRPPPPRRLPHGAW